MFNLLRGTGITGAAAMRECNGRLLRPLLAIGRAEVERYALRHHLEWCEDESNRDTRHARNFLRQQIFPELTRRFPATARNLAAAAARFAEASDLLDELARLDLGPESADFPLRVDMLNKLNEARGRNVLRYLLKMRQVQIPSEARLREALRQLLTAGADRHPAVIFGPQRLLRRRGWIDLEPIDLLTPRDTT